MINRTILVGRLTRDPELRKTNTGKSVASFTLACNRRFGQQEQADFINCVAWEKSAEFLANYLSKGALISVEGRIQSRSYEDATGKRVYVQEVVAETIQSLESKAQSQRTQASQDSFQPSYQADPEPSFSVDDEPVLDITSDDLPF
ncbi:single-stranded DNA-binding protein [Erysipelothrix inopinata]|uniref:Single-stranded DNA-binding protein n=1 Tax=Erysipelothrix inopinata TaxID=225084 RepID=A0A7G9S0Q3_9FIRM|nr:single-stranded DNA-binding protein [Erysipelothrix inopinata]QNN61428.1 single-stranded DNA-binding protein [Erysipelothrix inopinata]